MTPWILAVVQSRLDGGGSRAAVAAELGVSVRTLGRWVARYTELAAFRAVGVGGRRVGAGRKKKKNAKA